MNIIQKILAKFDNTPKIETIKTIKEPEMNFADASFLNTDDDVLFGIKDAEQKQSAIDHYNNIMQKQYDAIKSTFGIKKHHGQTFDSASSFFEGSPAFPYQYDNAVMNDMLIQNNLFRGFAYYSYFAIVPMINNAVNAYVKDILRGGFKFVSTDAKNDHADLIDMLNKEWEQFKCDAILKTMLEKVLGLGGCAIYPKLRGDDRDNGKILEKELKVKNKTTIGEGDLLFFQIIEPTWCWPLSFNASEPLKPDFYKPQIYNVMGTNLHVSRFIRCVLWELPDLIKPVYYFWGLSLTGKMLQSLQNFEIIQTEIPSMIKRMNFNILKVPLAEGINGKNALVQRIKNFLYNISNFGMFIVNKDNEEFEQVTRNIAGLDDLVARFAELLSTTIQIPVTKLLGVSPKGFSTNDETGHRNWYDLVTGIRTTEVQPHMLEMANYLCLNKGVELPNTITIEWGNLEAINEEDEARTKELTAKADKFNVEIGAIDAQEVRQRLAQQPRSGYNNIDINKKIKLPEEPKKDTSNKDKKKEK